MTDTTTPDNQFTIPRSAWGDFVAKIHKMNRKAARLGCEPIRFCVIAESTVKMRRTVKIDGDERTREYTIAAKVIELHGVAPIVGDHEFIARVEYLADAKSVLFHTVPGSAHKIDDRFRALRPNTCEHCNQARLRSETFVVRNRTTGEQRQVGRNCLADFTGIHTPQALASKASWLHTFATIRDDVDGMWSAGSLWRDEADTQHMLALTSAYVSLFGWVPKSAASEFAQPTASLVARHFWHGGPQVGEKAEMERAAALVANDPAHLERADAVVAWVKTDLAARARSDYEMNLVTLVSLELAEAKHAGLVCSAFTAWQRAMNQQVEYANKRKAAANSQHVGKVGERLKGLQVQVQFVKALEAGAWGARTLVKFVDAQGNVLTWFASGDREYRPGAALTIDGTVKAHKDYQGNAETALTRVKAVEPAPAGAP